MRRMVAVSAAAVLGWGVAVSPVGAEAPVTDPAIADVLAEHPSFASWSQLLAQAGLTDMLSSCEGDTFVVLVPTDDAVAALVPADGSFEDLLADKGLADLVLGHVFDGGAELPVEEGVAELETLPGGIVTVAATEDGLAFGDARQAEDIVVACNGTIVPLDTVLSPGVSLAQEADDDEMVDEDIVDDEIIDDEILGDDIIDDDIIDDEDGLPYLGTSNTALSLIGTASLLAGWGLLRLRRRIVA